MIILVFIVIEGYMFNVVIVLLLKIILLIILLDKGYIMCGVLDVGLLNDKLVDC